ncbi:MAG: hypothetical protein EOP10_15750 [Proteobacteria bacterium]|nr:MAG: hypothetical protein EOP10_15750 [Pseudomonadota bacterium]
MEKIAVVCMRHPKYDGQKNPELRCKACCSIFVNRIKALNAQRALDVSAWLDSKSTAQKSAATGG